jgi:hypothetical protein
VAVVSSDGEAGAISDVSDVSVDLLTQTYRDHYGSLLKLAALLLDDLASCEDVVQEAFIRVHSARTRVRDPEKVLAYLRQTVVNLSRSALRRRLIGMRLAPKPMPDMASAEEGAYELLEKDALIQALRGIQRRHRGPARDLDRVGQGIRVSRDRSPTGTDGGVPVSAPHEDDMAPRPPDGEPEPSVPVDDEPWDAGASGDGFDEIGSVLRERFRQAVSTLEPGPGTLDYLRRAVPARRRRRNAALAATAVSVFVVSAGGTLAARGSFDSGGSSTAGNTAIGNLLTTATDDAPGGGSGHGPGTPDGQDLTSDGSAGAEQPSSPASAGGTSKAAATSVPSAAVSGSPLTPLCQNSSVTALTATSNGTTDGVTYETFAGTAKSACTLNGMPGLLVTAASGAPVKVPVYKADGSAAPLLPQVPAVQALLLQPGERFEFQLAWAPLVCSSNPPPTVPPASGSTSDGPTSAATSAGPTPTGGPITMSSSQPTPSGTPSSSVPSSSIYSVAYAVYGSQPAQSVNFRADCGATIYVTNYFPAPGPRSTENPTTAATSAN